MAQLDREKARGENMNGMRLVNKLKLSLGKEGLADLMLHEGADDEKEYALMLNAEAIYLYRDRDDDAKNPPFRFGKSEEFYTNMFLLSTNKKVRNAFMAGDYEKCQEFTDAFLENPKPDKETRLRIEKFVDDNTESWIQKGYIGNKKQEVKK